MAYRILLVAHDPIVRVTRGAILAKSGYDVTPAQDADSAFAALQNQSFDLILVGRDSQYSPMPVEERIRQQYPTALILKVTDLASPNKSYSSEITAPNPEKLLASIKFMLATAGDIKTEDENETELEAATDGVRP